MKKGDLRELFEGTCLNTEQGDGRVRVLVSLHAREPDPTLLAHLKSLGLAIERVIGNTVLGSIPPAQMATLRRDKGVIGVEPSVQLKPHQAGDAGHPRP